MVERAESDQADHRPLKGEKQYRDFLLQSLGVTSLLLALLICYFASLPSALAEELAFTAEEVESFAVPGARLLAKSKIPDGVKTSLVNSGDYIGLGTAAVAYVYRILSAVKANNNGNYGQTPVVQPINNNGSNAAYTATVNAGHLAGWGNFTAG